MKALAQITKQGFVYVARPADRQADLARRRAKSTAVGRSRGVDIAHAAVQCIELRSSGAQSRTIWLTILPNFGPRRWRHLANYRRGAALHASFSRECCGWHQGHDYHPRRRRHRELARRRGRS